MSSSSIAEETLETFIYIKLFQWQNSNSYTYIFSKQQIMSLDVRSFCFAVMFEIWHNRFLTHALFEIVITVKIFSRPYLVPSRSCYSISSVCLSVCLSFCV